MNFQGTWTLCKSLSFDDILGSEHIWTGSFMECMTIVAYENMGPIQFNVKTKIIVCLYDLISETEGTY